MTEPLAPAAPAAQPAAAEGDTEQRGAWGVFLDIAGALAAVALILIVADIWTDGRLISRRLIRRPGGEPGEAPPPQP